MAIKKIFTDASLKTLIDEIKSYISNAISTKANANHTHTIANITNLQSTLDGKAASSHNHSASNINSGTLSSDRLPTVPVSKGGTGATTAAGVLTNLGITATAAELNKLDGVTATTTELNYVDGVTSNIQTQLDGKANSSHNHSAANITSGTLSSDRLPTVPISKGGTGATTSAGVLTNLGITATATELNYVDGVTSSIQSQINGKAASSHSHSYLALSGGTMTGTITTKTGAGISAKGNNGSWSNGRTITNAAIYFPTASVSDGSRYDPLIAGETTEGYVWNIGAGATNQMGFYGYKKSDTNNATLWSATFNPSTGKFTSTSNIKAPTFEGSLSGNASSATKLGTSAGSATQPVYFSDGKPVATTYTLGKSVPADAKFTDTNTWRPVQNNLTSTSTTDALSAAQGTALKALVDGKAASSHTHNYAGSSSIGGSANSAVKLDSSAGASNKPIYFSGGKPVAGGYELNANIKAYSGSLSSEGWKSLGGRASGSLLSISYNSAGASWNSGTYSASLVWGCNDTKGLLDCSYSTPIVTFGGSSASGGSDNAPTWYMKLSGTSAKTYNLDNFAASSHNHAASNITSGTLSSDRLPTVPITKGGTGATTAAAALTNFGLTATSTELNYMDGVTSNVQTQLNNKLPLAGGTLTGALNFANSVWNTVGDDAYMGDCNVAGCVGVKGKNGNTGINFVPYSGSTAQKISINGSGTMTISGTVASTFSGSLSGNASTATTLQTARTIALGTGATGTATSFNGGTNITIPVTDVKESYLSWGGKSLSGSVSPIDAASSNIHSANRFTFAKPAGITVEYSTDGNTYSAYSTTDSAKINLVSGNGNTYYIGARSASTTVNDKLRITLNATNMGVYTRLRKLLINISTGYSSGSNVIIEKAMKGSETTFTTVGTYSISGWSGWNSIPISAAFGGGSNQTGNIAVLRLTFGITGVNANQTANALQIMDIIGIGDTYWAHPSTMAKTGHLYTYDSSQNATFPANITATTFVGALSGNATTSTTATKLGSSTVGGAAKPIYLNAGTATACSSTVGSATQPVYMNGGTITACTYKLEKSVPSNAVFTDTNTKVTNTLATTTKAYVTGTTSATTNTGTQVFDTGVYLDTTAGKLTADTFNGATFSGSGVATVAEVKTYLGIS